MEKHNIHIKTVDTDTFIILLENYKKEVTKTKKKSKEFLVELGLINSQGEVQENYKDLCIPTEQE